MKVARRWLLRGLSLLLLVAAVAAGTVWWAVATEAGTRWLLGQALDYVQANVEVRELSGTLWHGVRFKYVGYTDVERRIELFDLNLQIDWSESSTSRVAVARLATERLTVVSFAESVPESEPLNLDVPVPPIRVSVETIDIETVDVDETSASGIAIRNLDVEDLQAQIASAAATVDGYELRFDTLEVQLRDDVPMRTGFSWRAADDSWSGEGGISGSLRNLKLEHDLHGEYPMRSIGTVDLSDPRNPSIDIVSTFQEWRYEEWIATDGEVRLFGAVQDYQSEVAVSVTGGGQLAARVRGEVRGNESGFTSVDLAVDALDGSARVSGNAQWSPTSSTDLMVSGTNMDLSSLTGGFATKLDWELRLIATGPENFTVEARRLVGSYNNQPVLGTGSVSRDGEHWRCRQCDAAIGDNRLQADLSVRNGRLDGTVHVDAPSMQQLHPEVTGSMRAAGALRGSFQLPILSGNLAARELMVKGWSIESLLVDTRSVTTEDVDVVVEVEGLANEGQALGSGDFHINGRLDQLSVESRWAVEELRIVFATRVTMSEDLVTGRVLSGLIDHPDMGPWTMMDPADVVVTSDGVIVEGAQWSNGDARLRIGRIISGADSLSLEIELNAAPIAWLDGRTPSEVSFDGYADAFLDLQRSNGDWSGQFEWQQRETLLRIEDGEGDQFEVAVPLAEAEASLGPSGASIRARLEADGDTKVDLVATASDLSPEATIDAHLAASAREWDWLSAFFPEVEEIVGSVHADFVASGRVGNPQLKGELRLSNGAIVLPAFNVPVTDINARASGGYSGSLTLSGEARAGTGDLSIAGTITDLISLAPRLIIEVRGNEATVLDWPDYALVASPDLSLTGEGDQYHVDGRVRLDRAEIMVRELPEGAVTPSDDVFVIGGEESRSRATRLSGEFDIELAESVHVRAFGLDTNLEGELRITLPANGEPRANGELELVGGFFKMYGQRLEIERGTMLFSGALDNPFVNVRVVRSIDSAEGTIEVGADIMGRADALTSTLYSVPAMSEAEVLSYLVTGHSLGQAGSADRQLISDAAFSLGLRQAAVITNQVGKAVGLDELTLEGSSQDAAALIAGKEISSNLYARYRYPVFSNLAELLLRYGLTESLSVELSAGEFQSIDIQYTIERE